MCFFQLSQKTITEKSVESIQCFFQLSEKTIIELVDLEEAQNLRSGQLLAQNLNDSEENWSSNEPHSHDGIFPENWKKQKQRIVEKKRIRRSTNGKGKKNQIITLVLLFPLSLYNSSDE